MVNWSKFDPSEHELEFNDVKLAAHGIERYEAAEVLWSMTTDTGCSVEPMRDGLWS